MNEKEFREKYELEKPLYYTWGKFVQNAIIEELQKQNDINIFLKIPLGEPRIKLTDSLLAKAFHRNKDYASPYDDITDKVGIRFVVLLSEETKIVKKIIESLDGVLWKASMDKDFETEREKSPEHFTYESIHYVVFNNEEREYDKITLPIGIPCEIQIRTLLQHAYAEMSHDTIYKSQVKVAPLVKRYMARSMALVESADCFFSESVREIAKQSKEHESWAYLCSMHYPISDDTEKDLNVNTYLIDQLIPLLKDVEYKNVKVYLQEKSSILQTIITKKQNISWIYRQPAVLLVYYLIENKNTTLQREWPMTDDLLNLLLSDIGVAPLSYI